jgi:hypothetical protein
MCVCMAGLSPGRSLLAAERRDRGILSGDLWDSLNYRWSRVIVVVASPQVSLSFRPRSQGTATSSSPPRAIGRSAQVWPSGRRWDLDHQVVRLRRPLREGRGCGGFGTVLNFLIGSPSCTVISFICVQWFFWQLEDSNVRHSFCSLFVRKRWTGRARGVRGWKASHQTLSLGPEVVLLWAFDFNRDKIMCTIF